jgi:hypothetical protein
MGSIVPLVRRAPLIRTKRVRPDETESHEATRSMHILLWTFAATALAMCAIVVACFANTWIEVWWISSFLLVFTLCKIGLANALFYGMIHYDKERQATRTKQAMALKPLGTNPTMRRRIVPARGMLKVATTSAKSPRPSAPR